MASGAQGAVSFTPDQVKNGVACFNYQQRKPSGEDVVGISVFAKDDREDVFHTYSAYSRGVDMLNGAYHYIDLTPEGRGENGHAHPQFWVYRHDEYEG
ncbi:MAG: DUF899 family protein [Candidatus Binataceae bacterium]